jgi:hypothetical protein
MMDGRETYTRMKRAQRMIKGPSLALGTKTIYIAIPTISSTKATIKSPRTINAEGNNLMAVRNEILGLGVTS